jgi:drug/metabolite transporter (DMT)-like permease
MRDDTSLDRRSVWLMLASVGLFAVNTLMIRAISMHTPAVDGWLATVFRGGVGLIVVFAMFGMGRGLDVKRVFRGRLITMRGVVGALGILAFYITVVKMGAARAVIINLTYPMFASIIAVFWLKEKLSRAALVWMGVGFCGLVVFLNGGGQAVWPTAYDLLALAGAVGAGWVVVVIRRLRHEEHPATIYASQAFYSLAIAAPVTGKLPALPAVAWWGLAAAAMLVTAGQLVMTRAYQQMSVARGSSLQMLLPLVTALGGFLFFGETFRPLEIAGALVTLLATWRVVVSG